MVSLSLLLLPLDFVAELAAATCTTTVTARRNLPPKPTKLLHFQKACLNFLFVYKSNPPHASRSNRRHVGCCNSITLHEFSATRRPASATRSEASDRSVRQSLASKVPPTLRPALRGMAVILTAAEARGLLPLCISVYVTACFRRRFPCRAACSSDSITLPAVELSFSVSDLCAIGKSVESSAETSSWSAVLIGEFCEPVVLFAGPPFDGLGLLLPFDRAPFSRDFRQVGPLLLAATVLRIIVGRLL